MSLQPICAPEARPYLLAAAILASSLGFIDGTVVAIAMPAIRASLDASLTQAQWVHNAYMLTLSALILAGGAMGDRFGLARVFAAGIGLFVLASLACALAPSAEILVPMRAVQGVGAAIMVPGSMALIARAYPAAERGRAIGIWAAASALTTAAGPVIGGLALSLGGDGMWRWIFAVNLPLGALALALLLRHAAPDRGRPERPVDWTGAALATGTLLMLAWGLGTTGAGTGAGAWLAGAGAGLVLFLWSQARGKAPMMPLDLFRNRVFSVVNLACFTLYAALNIVLFYLPMVLIAGWGIDAFSASAAFAPLSVFIFALSARMGRIGDRVGIARMLGLGATVAAAGYAALALAMPTGAYWGAILPAMCGVGLGMAMVVAPLSSAVMGAVSEDHAGVASGVNNAITRISGLIAVAAAGGLIARIHDAGAGPGGFGVVSDLPGAGAATVAAFLPVVWSAAGLAGATAVLAWVMLPRSARQPAP